MIEADIRINAPSAAFVPVTVKIHQARTEIFSAQVEFTAAWLRRERFGDRRNVTLSDADVENPVDFLRWVDDVRVAENQVHNDLVSLGLVSFVMFLCAAPPVLGATRAHLRFTTYSVLFDQQE